MDYRDQLGILIQLSLVDNQLSSTEKGLIYSLGKGNGIEEREIDSLFEQYLTGKAAVSSPSFELISDEDKVDYLHNIILLMKVDHKVYLSEIRFCEAMAIKLGFKPQVIAELSARIFSDPSINSDRTQLIELAKKYKS